MASALMDRMGLVDRDEGEVAALRQRVKEGFDQRDFKRACGEMYMTVEELSISSLDMARIRCRKR